MANTASAKKEMRASARRAVRNRSVRSAVKTRISRARRAIGAASPEEALELTVAAIAGLDRAANKGVLHANNAARRKARLQRRLNQAQAGVLTTEPTKGTRRGAAAKEAGAAAKTSAKTSAKSSTKAAAKTSAKSAAKTSAKSAAGAKKPAGRTKKS